ncbi:MAG: SRPBCC domain-containing protein [Niabella sp.]|nr:MAG: SRPBCC domain-containing protein [Niabella sp.]
MNNDGIVIDRIFDAPKELVWKAWTDEEMAKKWWGPESFTAPSIKMDLRVGGRYVFAMHGPAGTEWDKDMYSAGEYLEIIPNEKLVVTDYFSDAEGNMMEPSEQGQDSNFPKVSTVTVLFETVEEGKTKLSIIYPRPETQEQMDAMLKSGMKEGWNSSLNKLELALKSEMI